MKGKSIKFLEEHIGVNLNDLGFGDRFLDMAPKHEQQTKKKKKNQTSSKLILCLRVHYQEIRENISKSFIKNIQRTITKRQRAQLKMEKKKLE